MDNEKGQLSAQIDALVSSHEAEVTQFRTVLAENEAAQQHTQQSLASYQDKVQHLNLETEECRRELQDWS